MELFPDANVEPDTKVLDTVADDPGTDVSIMQPDSPLPEPVLEDQTLLEPTLTTSATVELTVPEQELDPDLLEALGESTNDIAEFGDKIHENLAKLWPPVLKKGLVKEKRDPLLKEYLVPDNCRLLQAPKLNAEISAAVPDMVRNRDKILMTHQQQLGFGITAVNRALNLLLTGDERKQAIHHLSNACRILSDLHASNTNSRIKLLSHSLDKNFLHVIQDSERDETLFGNKLSDKIKAAKAIEKQGMQIKKTSCPKPSTSQSTASRLTSSGNWPAPPRYHANRGARGGRRITAPNRRPYLSSTQPPGPSKPPTANKARPPQ